MIETSGLTRHFAVRNETVEAVKGLDLRVETGEMVALLGPNGAGKSTTLRMLTTLLAPTSGTARVAGFDVATEQRGVRSRIGYIGQGNGAGHTQRGRDELVSQGRAYGMSASAARARAAELIESLDLAAVADRVVSNLSGGQRRRLDIAMGLIHAPALLFLDEPSTGLDPQNRANLQEHIQRLRADHGTTIVLTTHYLDEADSLAERVIVIDHGRVIADDTPARLKAEHASDRITLTFDNAEQAHRVTKHHALGIAEGATVTQFGTQVLLEVDGGAQIAPKLLRSLDDALIDVASIEVTRPTLDDVFLTLTGRSLREDVSVKENKA
ncbi:ATP-binding cassette domain-containing protein [Kibdelosporangium philippinense]|uniref:ATP-binding cassette domain-containing protein n=1 Tax=Kibdelosporangium philippinense TaxID=211113 RepID=A0ABS8ZS25_9PSEU|nr:ATP-binding cassette domain-containing protein [Kibdelosporangium philippinense]MCE7010472.1 ATP-binding cassette domain-containing protein [Kibdelosporangium philippinense]